MFAGSADTHGAQARTKVPRVARDDKSISMPEAEPIWRIVGEHRLWLLSWHAPFTPLPVERDQRPSPGPVAKSVFAVAHRDLLRRQDDADRFSRVLGISVAGAHEPMALSEVDG